MSGSESQPNFASISQSQSTVSGTESESQVSQNSQCSENSQNVALGACECEKIQGKRRDKMILHCKTEHQPYVRSKVNADGSIAYTCQVKKCPARLFEKDGVYSFSRPFAGHNHFGREKEIAEMKLLTEIKEKCQKPMGSQTTSQTSEVREIFDDAVLE